MPVPSAVVADRSAGVVLASAAADALGAPHEFGAPLDDTVELGMTGGGGLGWEPGEWTDDTQMALALLTPLAAGNRDIKGVEDGFIAWYASHPNDVGNQTAAVLSSGGPLLDSATRYQRKHRESAGNGGLMRIGPAALSFAGEPDAIAEYATATTSLTHPHVDCIDASVLWAVAIDNTIRLAPAPDQTWDFADAVRAATLQLPEDRRDRWMQLVDEGCVVRPADLGGSNGWVVHAFQAALSAIVHTPVPDGSAACTHLVSGIKAAVRGGGDTDTVAAIAGSLLGARWGATAVPLSWRGVLHGRRLYGMPPLAAGDLDMLARLAATQGGPDTLGWPGRDRLVPYYMQRFGSTPISVDLGGSRFGNVAALLPALEHGADVVVSLCRMGTDDVPPGVEHHVVGIIDTELEDNPNLEFVLADTADLIASCVSQGRNVYVHCVAAESRTPAVAAAYLARHGNMSVDAALQAVERAFGHLPYHMWLIDAVRGACR